MTNDLDKRIAAARAAQAALLPVQFFFVDFTSLGGESDPQAKEG